MDKAEYKYLIYDGRYPFDPDRATVMEVCDTLKEAQQNRTDYGDDCVIVRYRVIQEDEDSPELVEAKEQSNG